MVKRSLAAGLWFLAVWGVGGVVHLFLDFPRWLALGPAILAAGVVWLALGRVAGGSAQPSPARPPLEPHHLPSITAGADSLSG